MKESARNSGPWDLGGLREPPPVTWEVATGPQRSLYYEGAPSGGRPARVFAYLAVPERRRGKAPAMVLVHGGGGKAFPQWATQWAQRGYVALAMDLSGRGPDGRRLPDGGPELSDRSALYGIADGPAGSWAYHAVAAVIRAVSLLRAHPEVDADRIGITGISWGGYLTCIVAGLDDRLRLAIPVYGCGFLHENSVWKPMLDGMPEASRTAWIRNFDPSSYLAQAHLPMLWVAGTNDACYAFDSLQQSYRLAPGPRTLRVTVNMPHGHAPGWEPLEIAAFADQHLRRGTPLPQLGEMRRDGRSVRVAVDSALPLLSASLHYSPDAIAWDHRRWTSEPATIADRSVEARLPEERPLIFFLTVTDIRGAVVSTEHQVCGL